MGMNISIQKIRQLAELDDKQFGELIRTVILAAGGTKEQAVTAASSAPMLKEKLRTANEKELSQILALVGKGKAEKILKTLENA